MKKRTARGWDICVQWKYDRRHGDEDDYEYVTVKQRRIGEYGQPVGTSHNNPLLYMRQYEVQYAGRDTE